MKIAHEHVHQFCKLQNLDDKVNYWTVSLKF